jgi:hypothetical protein
MRRALATVTIAGSVALVSFTAATAVADDTTAVAGSVLSQQDDVDRDEPLTDDGNDDAGKYGLIGLTGLLGLFGYKKYKDHRAHTTGRTDTDGTAGGTSRRV